MAHLPIGTRLRDSRPHAGYEGTVIAQHFEHPVAVEVAWHKWGNPRADMTAWEFDLTPFEVLPARPEQRRLYAAIWQRTEPTGDRSEHIAVVVLDRKPDLCFMETLIAAAGHGALLPNPTSRDDEMHIERAELDGTLTLIA